MTQIGPPSEESFDDEIRQSRERLRSELYKGALPRQGSSAERFWSWLWLPLVAAYSCLGILSLLAPTPMPPVMTSLLLLLSAGSLFLAWQRGRGELRLRRGLSRAIDNHLRYLDKIVEERVDRSMKAKAATDARHEANRQRKVDAMAIYRSRDWRTQADAARSIADRFSVTEKVASRWVAEWRKEGNSAPEDGASSDGK